MTEELGELRRYRRVGRSGVEHHLEKLFSAGLRVDNVYEEDRNITKRRIDQDPPRHQRIQFSGCCGFWRMARGRPSAAA